MELYEGIVIINNDACVCVSDLCDMITKTKMSWVNRVFSVSCLYGIDKNKDAYKDTTSESLLADMFICKG